MFYDICILSQNMVSGGLLHFLIEPHAMVDRRDTNTSHSHLPATNERALSKTDRTVENIRRTH